MLSNLWRRAPAWRLTLLAALVFTTLTALFPPVHRHAAAPADPAPSFAPPPDRVPTAIESVAVPPPGAAREGLVAYAGHQLPLPPGRWRELAIERDESARPEQVMLLAQTAGTRLAGMLVALAPDPLSRPTGLLRPPQACTAPGTIAAEAAPPAANGDFYLHECWTLGIQAMKAGPLADPSMRPAFDRLAELGVEVPGRMLAMHYIRSTDTGWFEELLYLPIQPDTPARPDRALLAWARRGAALLHRGYDGALPAGTTAPPPPKAYE